MYVNKSIRCLETQLANQHQDILVIYNHVILLLDQRYPALSKSI